MDQGDHNDTLSENSHDDQPRFAEGEEGGGREQWCLGMYSDSEISTITRLSVQELAFGFNAARQAVILRIDVEGTFKRGTVSRRVPIDRPALRSALDIESFLRIWAGRAKRKDLPADCMYADISRGDPADNHHFQQERNRIGADVNDSLGTQGGLGLDSSGCRHDAPPPGGRHRAKGLDGILSSGDIICTSARLPDKTVDVDSSTWRLCTLLPHSTTAASHEHNPAASCSDVFDAKMNFPSAKGYHQQARLLEQDDVSAPSCHPWISLFPASYTPSLPTLGAAAAASDSRAVFHTARTIVVTDFLSLSLSLPSTNTITRPFSHLRQIPRLSLLSLAIGGVLHWQNVVFVFTVTPSRDSNRTHSTPNRLETAKVKNGDLAMESGAMLSTGYGSAFSRSVSKQDQFPFFFHEDVKPRRSAQRKQANFGAEDAGGLEQNREDPSNDDVAAVLHWTIHSVTTVVNVNMVVEDLDEVAMACVGTPRAVCFPIVRPNGVSAGGYYDQSRGRGDRGGKDVLCCSDGRMKHPRHFRALHKSTCTRSLINLQHRWHPTRQQCLHAARRRWAYQRRQIAMRNIRCIMVRCSHRYIRTAADAFAQHSCTVQEQLLASLSPRELVVYMPETHYCQRIARGKLEVTTCPFTLRPFPLADPLQAAHPLPTIADTRQKEEATSPPSKAFKSANHFLLQFLLTIVLLGWLLRNVRASCYWLESVPMLALCVVRVGNNSLEIDLQYSVLGAQANGEEVLHSRQNYSGREGAEPPTPGSQKMTESTQLMPTANIVHSTASLRLHVLALVEYATTPLPTTKSSKSHSMPQWPQKLHEAAETWTPSSASPISAMAGSEPLASLDGSEEDVDSLSSYTVYSSADSDDDSPAADEKRRIRKELDDAAFAKLADQRGEGERTLKERAKEREQRRREMLIATAFPSTVIPDREQQASQRDRVEVLEEYYYDAETHKARQRPLLQDHTAPIKAGQEPQASVLSIEPWNSSAQPDPRPVDDPSMGMDKDQVMARCGQTEHLRRGKLCMAQDGGAGQVSEDVRTFFTSPIHLIFAQCILISIDLDRLRLHLHLHLHITYGRRVTSRQRRGCNGHATRPRGRRRNRSNNIKPPFGITLNIQHQYLSGCNHKVAASIRTWLERSPPELTCLTTEVEVVTKHSFIPTALAVFLFGTTIISASVSNLDSRSDKHSATQKYTPSQIYDGLRSSPFNATKKCIKVVIEASANYLYAGFSFISDRAADSYAFTETGIEWDERLNCRSTLSAMNVREMLYKFAAIAEEFPWALTEGRYFMKARKRGKIVLKMGLKPRESSCVWSGRFLYARADDRPIDHQLTHIRAGNSLLQLLWYPFEIPLLCALVRFPLLLRFHRDRTWLTRLFSPVFAHVGMISHGHRKASPCSNLVSMHVCFTNRSAPFGSTHSHTSLRQRFQLSRAYSVCSKFLNIRSAPHRHDEEKGLACDRMALRGSRARWSGLAFPLLNPALKSRPAMLNASGKKRREGWPDPGRAVDTTSLGGVLVNAVPPTPPTLRDSSMPLTVPTVRRVDPVYTTYVRPYRCTTRSSRRWLRALNGGLGRLTPQDTSEARTVWYLCLRMEDRGPRCRRHIHLCIYPSTPEQTTLIHAIGSGNIKVHTKLERTRPGARVDQWNAQNTSFPTPAASLSPPRPCFQEKPKGSTSPDLARQVEKRPVIKQMGEHWLRWKLLAPNHRITRSVIATLVLPLGREASLPGTTLVASVSPFHLSIKIIINHSPRSEVPGGLAVWLWSQEHLDEHISRRFALPAYQLVLSCSERAAEDPLNRSPCIPYLVVGVGTYIKASDCFTADYRDDLVSRKRASIWGLGWPDEMESRYPTAALNVINFALVRSKSFSELARFLGLALPPRLATWLSLHLAKLLVWRLSTLKRSQYPRYEQDAEACVKKASLNVRLTPKSVEPHHYRESIRRAGLQSFDPNFDIAPGQCQPTFSNKNLVLLPFEITAARVCANQISEQTHSERRRVWLRVLSVRTGFPNPFQSHSVNLLNLIPIISSIQPDALVPQPMSVLAARNTISKNHPRYPFSPLKSNSLSLLLQTRITEAPLMTRNEGLLANLGLKRESFAAGVDCDCDLDCNFGIRVGVGVGLVDREALSKNFLDFGNFVRGWIDGRDTIIGFRGILGGKELTRRLEISVFPRHLYNVAGDREHHSPPPEAPTSKTLWKDRLIIAHRAAFRMADAHDFVSKIASIIHDRFQGRIALGGAYDFVPSSGWANNALRGEIASIIHDNFQGLLDWVNDALRREIASIIHDQVESPSTTANADKIAVLCLRRNGVEVRFFLDAAGATSSAVRLLGLSPAVLAKESRAKARLLTKRILKAEHLLDHALRFSHGSAFAEKYVYQFSEFDEQKRVVLQTGSVDQMKTRPGFLQPYDGSRNVGPIYVVAHGSEISLLGASLHVRRYSAMSFRDESSRLQPLLARF
ncbi:uncharacterized protein MYCFIDRAFT_180249 [Pseudocercospora fijiensis CIRAD86]|uniref:Uncharacterized protein n=1 Tax=Pseudocercospora fijiensis (strain CIRAD86) TaxID=383855 RepID=M2ZDB5_PSEFD|nr:uncharacterized protein MYCFIDRAFT_180249 [Pseudocercospora fijiensis CIRAD86]EME77104.1 hypothetical protein MYCFIDRAFT_180249 [Pseudocercospora fijiensis CIRAD86]